MQEGTLSNVVGKKALSKCNYSEAKEHTLLEVEDCQIEMTKLVVGGEITICLLLHWGISREDNTNEFVHTIRPRVIILICMLLGAKEQFDWLLPEMR